MCIELKSVKPNAGEMRGEKQKILEAKSALYNSFKDKKIEFYIGFPFDSTSDKPTTSNKDKFLGSIIDGKKYYDYSEVLLANELWDFLSSDEETMEQLLDIINSIAKPDFKEKYNKLININTSLEDKKLILSRWNLLSEVALIDNDKVIQDKIESDKRLKRIYTQSIFSNGKYKHQRKEVLKKLIER